MSVHMIDPHFSQALSNVHGLVEPKEICAAPPFIQGGDSVWVELPFFYVTSNTFQQFLFLRKIMHSFDDTRVPILWWLVFWIPD